jgi:putative sigma-54 modulation protein
MKVTYTGRQVELAPAQLTKLESRFAKVGKLVDGKEEREAHVILSLERHMHHAEITVRFFGHELVVVGSNHDLFTAINTAVDKLEKQVLKQRTKWRDTKRAPRKDLATGVIENPEPEPALDESDVEAAAGVVYRVNHHENRKPMTIDEALLEMENDLDYLVYRDSGTDRVSVLIRRRDGDFDLIEA